MNTYCVFCRSRSREFTIHEENEPQNIEQGTAEGRRKQAHTDLGVSYNVEAATCVDPSTAICPITITTGRSSFCTPCSIFDIPRFSSRCVKIA